MLSNATISYDELNKIEIEISNDLTGLCSVEEILLDLMVSFESDFAYLFHQKNISEKTIIELDKIINLQLKI